MYLCQWFFHCEGKKVKMSSKLKGINPNLARNTQHKRTYIASSRAVHLDAGVTTYKVR